MIGRGVFHDPYIFNQKKSIKNQNSDQKIKLLLKHLSLFEANHQDLKAFHTLKRFFKIYIRGFNHALTLRAKLMQTSSTSEVRQILNNFKL